MLSAPVTGQLAGGYVFEERGLVEMKGLREMRTFCLLPSLMSRG